MARGRRLKKIGGGELEVHKQNVDASNEGIVEQNVIIADEGIVEQNVVVADEAVCRNPSFGLATKAKGLQGAGLIVDPGVQLCLRKTLSVNEDIDLFF